MYILKNLNELIQCIIQQLGINILLSILGFIVFFLIGIVIYRIKSTKEVLSIWEDIPTKLPKYLDRLKYFRKFVEPSFYDRTYRYINEKTWSFKDLNKNIRAGIKDNPVIIIYAPAGMGKTRTCQQLLLLHRRHLKRSARYYKNDSKIVLLSVCKRLRYIRNKDELKDIIDSCTNPSETTLLLDGFDELPFLDGDENTTTGVLKDWLQYLHLKGGRFRKIIITMRLEPFSKALDYFINLRIAEVRDDIERATILELKPLTDIQAVKLFRYNTKIKKIKTRKRIEKIIKSNFSAEKNENIVNLFCIPFFATFADVIILKNNILPVEKAVAEIAKTDINNISQTEVITQSNAIDSIASGTIAQEILKFSHIRQLGNFEKINEEHEEQIKLSRTFLSAIALKLYRKSKEINGVLSLTQDEFRFLTSQCGIDYVFSTRSLLQRFASDSIAFLHGYFYEYFLIQASENLSRYDKISILNGHTINLNKKRMIDHYLHWLNTSGNYFHLYNCIRFIDSTEKIFRSEELRIVYKSKYTLDELFLLLPNLNKLFFSFVDEQDTSYCCCYNHNDEKMYSIQNDAALCEINSKIIRVQTLDNLISLKCNNIDLNNVYIFFELKNVSDYVDIYYELNNNEFYKSCHLIINTITVQQIFEVDSFLQIKSKNKLKVISKHKITANINYLLYFSEFLENAWNIFIIIKKHDINRPEILFLQNTLAAKKNELGWKLLLHKIKAYHIANKKRVYLHDLNHSKKKHFLFITIFDNLKKAIDFDSDKSVYYFNLAVLYFKFNKIHEAITYFTISIDKDVHSSFPECFFYRGKSYFIQGNYESSLIDYNKAIDLDTNRCYFYAARGDFFLVSNNIFDAIEDYNKSIKIYGMAEYYCKRGLAYVKTNNLTIAKDDFKKTITLSAVKTHYYYTAISALNAIAIIEKANNLYLKIDILVENGYIIPITIISKSYEEENIVFKNQHFSQIPDSSLRKNTYITQFPFINNIRMLGASSFRDCIQINNVELPNSLIKIDNYAFSGCEQLCEIHLNAGIIELGNRFIAYTKIKEIVIPYTVKKMEYALDRASFLKKVVFENGIKTIPDKAISSYYPDEKMPVEKIILPNTVEIIGREAFLNCVLLQDIDIPDSVKKICEFSFNGCIGLTEITIPAVEEIKEGAFNNCKYLTRITLGDSLKILGFRIFANTAIKEIHLPVSIQAINRAFDGADELQTVIFNEGTQLIPKQTFYSIHPLSGHLKVVIPSTVKNIPICAFENSKNITICCNEGSYAHKYAEENKIDYVFID